MVDVLKYRPVEPDPILGEEIVFKDLEFSPLDYDSLRNAKLHQPIQISMNGRGTVLENESSRTWNGKRATFSTTLESRYTSKAIGLVPGGRLPSALASVGDTIVLPDRCVVAQLNSRLKNGATKEAAEPDFVDLFADGPIRINPMLFVLEGDQADNPTSESLQSHLDEAVAKLRSALPSCEIVAADEKGLRGVLGLVGDSKDGMTRKQNFLLQMNERLKSPVPSTRREALWDEILRAARTHDLRTTSLVVLATLSTTVMPQNNNPARGLLKFGQSYTTKDAYNGLADIRALEILICLFSAFPQQRVMLCTADKDLALFWVGINASNFRVRDNHYGFDIAPAKLMPSITDAQWKSFIDADELAASDVKV